MPELFGKGKVCGEEFQGTDFIRTDPLMARNVQLPKLTIRPDTPVSENQHRPLRIAVIDDVVKSRYSNLHGQFLTNLSNDTGLGMLLWLKFAAGELPEQRIGCILLAPCDENSAMVLNDCRRYNEREHDRLKKKSGQGAGFQTSNYSFGLLCRRHTERIIRQNVLEALFLHTDEQVIQLQNVRIDLGDPLGAKVARTIVGSIHRRDHDPTVT